MDVKGTSVPRLLRSFWVCLILLFATLVWTALPAVAATAVSVDPFDVTITLNDDGSLDITESIWVWVTSGSVAAGNRWIPLDETDGIRGVQMWEDVNGTLEPFHLVDYSNIERSFVKDYRGELTTRLDGTRRYSVRTIADEPRRIAIDFILSRRIVSTAENNTPGIHLITTYHVAGALRSYPDAAPPVQQLWWNAIGEEYSASNPIKAGRVTVNLPAAISISSIKTDNVGLASSTMASSGDGKMISWRFGQVPSNSTITVRLQMPWVAKAAVAPAWQLELDQRAAQDRSDERREQWLHLVLLALGIGIAAGGGVLISAWWYARGRDPHTGLIAEVLTEPPSDLPAGVAGALLDEFVDARDIVATVLDLRRRGLISIDREHPEGDVQRWSMREQFTLTAPVDGLVPRERIVIEALFGLNPEQGAVAWLENTGHRLLDRFPEIKSAIYEELKTRGLMTGSPARTRKRWRIAGLAMIAAAIVGGIAGLVISEPITLVPVVSASAIGAVMFGASKAMPRKTVKGAEEAAKWSAFRRYLRDIRRFDPDAHISGIMDRYLPFMIALGIEESWVERIVAERSRADEGFWSRMSDVLSGGPILDGDWLHGPSAGAGPVFAPGRSMNTMPDPFTSMGGPGLSTQTMSDTAAHTLSSGSNEAFSVLDGLAILLEIGSIFLGGGKGGGGGGGSFHS